MEFKSTNDVDEHRRRSDTDEGTKGLDWLVQEYDGVLLITYTEGAKAGVWWDFSDGDVCFVWFGV